MPDELVLGLVIAGRLLVPLLILRYPLPGLLASIMVDGDRALLSTYTDLSLVDYQLYDKAFDVYYLSLAYVSTLRNWSDQTAIAIARVLWLYRLVGVALFALTDDHRVLFVFAAAFEFFFVGYEAIRVRWSPSRLTGSSLMVLAAVAWLAKLPQEYWLHVARFGTTAWIQRHVLPLDLARVATALVVMPLLVTTLVLAGWLVLRWLPEPDHRWTFRADGRGDPVDPEMQPSGGTPGSGLTEKVAVIALLGMLSAEFLPGLDENAIQVGFGLAFLAIGNAMIGNRLATRLPARRTAIGDVAVACLMNAPIAVSLIVAARWAHVPVPAAAALGLVLVASLLIGLYDRYHSAYREWLGDDTDGDSPSGRTFRGA